MEVSGTNKIIKSIENLLYNLKKANYIYDGNENELISKASLYNSESPDILNFNATHKETGIKCYIMYKTFKRISKNYIYEIYTDELNEEKGDFMIVVVDDEPLETIQSYLKHEANLKYYIHIFNLASLQFKILEHKYVPEHIILNEEEKNEFYKKFNIKKDSQIPEISRYDPVANAIFLKPGQICKILRYDKTSFVNEYYRICI
jgi:DNA-directed RNA polymerase subunit H (RpoH/RPB5)